MSYNNWGDEPPIESNHPANMLKQEFEAYATDPRMGEDPSREQGNQLGFLNSLGQVREQMELKAEAAHSSRDQQDDREKLKSRDRKERRRYDEVDEDDRRERRRRRSRSGERKRRRTRSRSGERRRRRSRSRSPRRMARRPGRSIFRSPSPGGERGAVRERIGRGGSSRGGGAFGERNNRMLFVRGLLA